MFITWHGKPQKDSTSVHLHPSSGSRHEFFKWTKNWGQLLNSPGHRCVPVGHYLNCCFGSGSRAFEELLFLGPLFSSFCPLS
jgi:hypothetical protein